MKKYITFLLFLLVSCNNQINDSKSKQVQDESDSVLMRSNENIQVADTIQKKSDSTTKSKVDKVVTQIRFLTKEVDKFKTERITLMNELKLAKENTIVRIDTVFVETKKNFWGKEKISVNTKSETKSTEITDSILSEKKVIDTLNRD